MKINNTHSCSGERGIALFMAIFCLMLLSAIAAGFMFLANTETAVNSNYRESQKAYFGARAGVEEARARLAGGAANPLTIPAGVPTLSGGRIIYITNPTGATDTVQPWNTANKYFDDTLCQIRFGDATLNSYVTGETPTNGVRCTTAPSGSTWYTQVNSTFPNTNTPSAMPYKWVRVVLKWNNMAWPNQVDGAGTNVQACWNGTAEVLLPAGKATCAAAGWSNVYAIASLGLTPSGARRMYEMEVVPPVTLPVQAAVFSKLNSNYGDSMNVTGYTEAGCAAPNTSGGLAGPGATVTTPGSGNVLGSPYNTQGNQPFPYNFPGIINSLKNFSTSLTTAGAVAGQTAATTPGVTSSTSVVAGTTVTTYTGTPSAPLGTAATPQITYVAGSGDPAHPNQVTLTGLSGQGVLLIDGNLTVHSSGTNLQWKGLIMVTGNIVFDGGGDPSIHGAVVGGGTFLANSPSFNNVSIVQNACLINQSFDKMPLSIVSSRELPY